MLKYAISLGSVGREMTPPIADALRQSKMKNVELPFIYFSDGNIEENRRLVRELLHDNVIKIASVHIPFGAEWDISCADESGRKAIIEKLTKLIEENKEFLGPEMTLHGGMEPTPEEEHPQRIVQTRKSIADLLPLAEKYSFSLNIEFLPRTCVGNKESELLEMVRDFPEDKVGIVLDVNHVMTRVKELPKIIETLASRIHSFHISDYDGLDEQHWFPGQGLIDWPAVMKAIRAIGRDLLLITENAWQLRGGSMYFPLQQAEFAVYYLENCDRIYPEFKAFQIPGN